ncbi:MAG: ShlB/FhaC/HecB family hemolysin secretion/activation protein [Myxococcota bacterium]
MTSRSRIVPDGIRSPRPAATDARLLVALAALLLPASEALAQVIDRPADDLPELPSIEQPAPPRPILPPVPTTPLPREQLSAGPGVFVESYRIQGSRVFSLLQLEGAVAPWAGREIDVEDLVSVRNALTRLYIANGYVNSGATLPDQDFEGGVVVVRIVEGSLGDIRISDNEQFRDGYLRDRVALGAETPLDVKKLERQLQILQLDPRITQVVARLAPGDRRGEATLFLRIEEAPRVAIDVHFNDYEPPSIGALAGVFEGGYANLIGWGDTLESEFTISEGLKRYRGLYEIPLTRWDTRLSLDARYASSRVVEKPFDDLDIASTFQSYQIGLHQPVYKTPGALVELGLIGDWRQSETELDGSSVSFPGSGANDGKATAAVLRFLVETLLRDQSQVLAARSQLSVGLDVLNATRNPGREPDGTFVAWLLQLQWARRFAFLDIETIFRTDLQLSTEPLLTMEQIAVGGHGTVRGYRENQFVQDQGVVSSLELRVPLWRQPKLGSAVVLAPFVDYGRTWSHGKRTGDREKSLASAGVGLRWALSRFLDARIYWGKQLTDVETTGDLQDHGVQFQISGHLGRGQR